MNGLEQLRQACQRDANNPENWQQLGDAYVKQAMLQDASECYRRLARLRPTASSYCRLGRSQLLLVAPADALPNLQKARELDPHDPEVASALGTAYLRARKWQEAKPLLAQAAAADHNNEEAHMGLAKIAVIEGNHRRAVELCNHVLKHNPIDALSPLALCGDCLIVLSALPEAEKCYQTLVELAPANVAAKAGLAQVYILQRRLDEANALLAKAAKQDPTCPQVYLGYGNLASARGELVQAQNCYQNSVLVDPTCVDGYAGLSSVLILQGKLESAAAVAQQGLAVNPDHPSCLLCSAQALELQGKAGEAVKPAQRAVEIMPENFQAHLILGRILLEIGKDLDAAAMQINQALTLSPEGKTRENIQHLKQSLEAYQQRQKTE